MSEPETPPPPPPGPPEPPQPPSGGPPPSPSASAGGGEGNVNTVMVVLSYLWILALVPLLVEKEDKEVQWHAKHGLVLLVAEIILWVAFTVISMIPGLGCLGALAMIPVWIATLVVRVVCIVKGVGGGRFLVPGVSQYADRF